MGSVKQRFSPHMPQGCSMPLGVLARFGQVRRHSLPVSACFDATSLGKLVPSARAVRPSAASERIVGPSTALFSARVAALAFPSTAWQVRAFFHPKSNHSVKRTPRKRVAAYLERYASAMRHPAIASSSAVVGSSSRQTSAAMHAWRRDTPTCALASICRVACESPPSLSRACVRRGIRHLRGRHSLVAQRFSPWVAPVGRRLRAFVAATHNQSVEPTCHGKPWHAAHLQR